MLNFNQILENNKPRSSQSTTEPFTGPEASMFTEKEAKRIITDYNKILESIIQENDILQIENKQLERTIMAQSKQITDIKTKNQEILVDQEYYQMMIKEYLKQLKENKNVYNNLCQFTQDQKNPNDEQNELLINFESDEMNKDEINKVESKLEKPSLNSLFKMLSNQNTQLKASLNKYYLDKITPKLCIVCGETYDPSQNTEKSCIYHPGKIKYFSCRGCGKDEYYTCCLYCGSCKKGCRMKKHMSQL